MKIFYRLMHPLLTRTKRLCERSTDLLEDLDIALRRWAQIPGFTDEEVLKDMFVRLRREFGDYAMIQALDRFTSREHFIYPN